MLRFTLYFFITAIVSMHIHIRLFYHYTKKKNRFSVYLEKHRVSSRYVIFLNYLKNN